MLGTVYADLFPQRVATMVLDGAVDVNAPLTQQADEEAPAAEQSLLHLFATCLQQAPCPLGTDPEAFWAKLSASMTDHPLPAPGHGDTTPVTVGDLDTATLLALSVPQFTASYYPALLAAEHGNGTQLRTLALAFATDTNGAPLVDPQWAITCNDAAIHPGPVAAGNLARTLNARYPLIGGYSVTYTMGGCVSWPAATQPVTDVHPKGTPADHGHRQHRRPQHPDHRSQASGRHLPHRQHGDVEGVGPHLAAQRFWQTSACRSWSPPTSPVVGSRLRAPSATDRLPYSLTLSRRTARRGHSAAALVAKSTRSGPTGVPSTMG